MNLAILDTNNLPQHLVAVKAQTPAINLGGASDTRNRITMKNGRFILKIAGSQEKVLDILKLPVIIVAAHDYVSRMWYKDRWVPGMKARPACFSADGVVPSDASPVKQAQRCDLCPQNQKGSGENGGKACSFFKRVVVLIAGKATPFILDVKSMSIFGTGDTANGKYSLTEYSKLLAGKGISPSMIVTSLTFDAGASVPKIFFTPDSFITEDMAAQVQSLLADKELLDSYKQVDLDSMGDDPTTAATAPPVNNSGPAPSNIQQQQKPPATVTVQPQVMPQTQAAPVVKKFSVNAAEEIADVPQSAPQPQQQNAAPASSADIDALLNGINFD